jgi:hypothetical protein
VVLDAYGKPYDGEPVKLDSLPESERRWRERLAEMNRRLAELHERRPRLVVTT